ncbi:hypothetical protein P7H22_20980 [Paenibacillus larvae]|nr:hypothetical protein [Paenibacillus larvae]MDT2242338.1 hypothetical protein [Paenibacillus larvae]
MRDVQRQGNILSSEWNKKVPDEQIQEWLMELISSDGFAYGYRKLTVACAENTSYRSIRRKCIAYVRSWTSCFHNDGNLLCIHENWLVTERLLTPTSSSGSRH